MSMSANLWRALLVAIVLTALVLLLAIDTSSRLLEPRQFGSRLPFCTVNTLAGSVKVQTVDSMAWKEVRDGMRLESGSLVRTLPDSYALLTFFDGTTTKLEPQTDLAVVKLGGATDDRPYDVLLKQWTGKTWNQVTKVDNGSVHFGIETPSASAIVRGTVFLTEVEKSGKTIIKTNKGRVDVAAQGHEVQVSAGNETRVERGMPPAAPAPTTPPGNELTVRVSGPAVVKIVDPNRSSSGYLSNGSPVNQIIGSDSFIVGEDTHAVRIADPGAGAYTAVFSGTAAGAADYDIQMTAEGITHLRRTGSLELAAGSEQTIRFNVDAPGVTETRSGSADSGPSLVEKLLAYFKNRDYDSVLIISDSLVIILLIFLYAWIRR